MKGNKKHTKMGRHYQLKLRHYTGYACCKMFNPWKQKCHIWILILHMQRHKYVEFQMNKISTIISFVTLYSLEPNRIKIKLETERLIQWSMNLTADMEVQKNIIYHVHFVPSNIYLEQNRTNIEVCPIFYSCSGSGTRELKWIILIWNDQL